MKYYLVLCCVVMNVVLLTSGQVDYERESEEKRRNYVELEIYSMTPAKFDSDYGARLFNIVASRANDECRDTPEECSVELQDTDAGSFSVDLVHPLDNYPKESDTGDTVVRFSLHLPVDSGRMDHSSTYYYITKRKLEEILLSSTSDFHERTGYYIVKVNDNTLGIPPAWTMNAIMITIGLVMLLACIIAYVALKKVYGDHPPVAANVRNTDADGNIEEKERLNHGNNQVV